MSSLTGRYAEPGLAAYGATKAALIRLCESITAEQAENGVSATAVAPGYVNTDMAPWTHDTIDPAAMIRAEDIAELISAITRLSRWAVVPALVVTRPGASLYRP